MTDTSIPLANWNGVEMPLSEVKVSVLDRSFLFGDAVYEVIRVYRGQPFLFEDHCQRLARNLEKMRIAADASRIAEQSLTTLAHSGLREATIYLQVTRGEAPRTHRFPSGNVTPNVLIYVKEFHETYAAQRKSGARVLLTPDLRWKRCDIKSVNLLANCLAAEAAHEAGCVEAVFVEPDGTLTEGSHTSLFGVRDGAIVTAPLAENILPGITRKLVLRLAGDAGIPVVQQPIVRDRLHELDELFLTGTTTEIMPVIQADEIVIGTGHPGPVVQRLQAAYLDAVNAANA